MDAAAALLGDLGFHDSLFCQFRVKVLNRTTASAVAQDHMQLDARAAKELIEDYLDAMCYLLRSMTGRIDAGAKEFQCPICHPYPSQPSTSQQQNDPALHDGHGQ